MVDMPDTALRTFMGYVDEVWSGVVPSSQLAAAQGPLPAYPVPPAPLPPTSSVSIRSWMYYLESYYDRPPGADVTIPALTGGASALPKGTPTKIPNGSPAIQLAYTRENESAVALAQAGYDITQNPPKKPNGKRPDYLIQGEYFDNIAPNSADARNVASSIQKKVDSGQADRIVLNVSDWQEDPRAFVQQLKTYPINGLKEIIVVTSDPTAPVSRLYPTIDLPNPASPEPPAPPPPSPPTTPHTPAPAPAPPPPTAGAPSGPAPQPPEPVDPTLGDV
jgi:hypothetical protein